MSTHNLCLYKEVDKKVTGCNLKITGLLDSVLIGVCAVIRLNTVFKFQDKYGNLAPDNRLYSHNILKKVVLFDNIF